MKSSLLRRFSRLLFFAAPLVALADESKPPPFYFSTLAGQASRGSADGTGSAAHFNFPNAAAVDSAGNVFVADSGNHTIRRISPAGVVSTFAGTAGSPGSADGTGGTARFSAPAGVTVDGTGNVFVADQRNSTIRKITPLGVVTTLAGTAGSSGSADGTGSEARFFQPAGMTVDGAGNVFVADEGNHTIRKITVLGVVTTLAGTAGSTGSADGTGSTARFFHPAGVAVDGAGNVFVADQFNNTIRKITAQSVVTTLAGTAGSIGSADGTGSTARFFFPQSVAVDKAGSVFVADIFNFTVRQITSAGVVTTLAGKAGANDWVDGTGSAARFGYLAGVAVDGAGNVYAVDLWHNMIRKITAAGVVTSLAGTGDSIGTVDGASKAARFYYPHGVAVDRTGNVFVADKFNSTIRRISPQGVVTTVAGSPGSSRSSDGTGSDARFDYPHGLAVDDAGNVYASEPTSHTIRKITSTGVVTTFAGSAGNRGFANGTGQDARFDTPYGLAVDGAGNVYVADRNNQVIRHITPAGVVTTIAGAADRLGSTVSTGSTARFSGPEGVAVDKAGNVYVAEYYNCTISKIAPDGIVTTLAGQAGLSGTADGTGGEARFDHPSNIAVDAEGNVFVTDTSNQTFRRITPAGVATTIAGSAKTDGGADDGIGDAARFFHPTSLAIDRAGIAYVADTENNTIRQGQLAGPPVMTSQPQSHAARAGDSVVLTVAAGGVPAPTYQWFFNGGPFSGATSSTLSFANARASDAGDYTVVVTNALGSVTSNKATLTVTSAPAPAPAPAPASGGTGGGGAISWWALAALLAASVFRSVTTRRQAIARS